MYPHTLIIHIECIDGGIDRFVTLFWIEVIPVTVHLVPTLSHVAYAVQIIGLAVFAKPVTAYQAAIILIWVSFM